MPQEDKKTHRKRVRAVALEARKKSNLAKELEHREAKLPKGSGQRAKIMVRRKKTEAHAETLLKQARDLNKKQQAKIRPARKSNLKAT